MSKPSAAEDLVGRTADDRLLGSEIENLPPSVGRPEAIPESHARARLVGIGVALTGGSLVAGLALLAVGVVLAAARGFGLLALATLVAGAVLAGTHWGWVHVAELTANSMQVRRDGDVLARRRQWLIALEPYPRWEVSTEVGEDGSITIVRTRYSPIARGETGFTFAREVEASEAHSGDEAGAAIAERAELMRGEAARDTEGERERYAAAADAYETEALADTDEGQRLAARRAASRALSERINSNLRDPPLAE